MPRVRQAAARTARRGVLSRTCRPGATAIVYDAPTDDEWIDEADEGLDDTTSDVLVCPSCRRPVHEETQQCPHCGDWITPVYPTSPVRRFVWVAVVMLLVFALAGFTLWL
ncbi:MAG: hypothetical protein ACE5E6_00925 [Phycisphaerae bacterium]